MPMPPKLSSAVPIALLALLCGAFIPDAEASGASYHHSAVSNAAQKQQYQQQQQQHAQHRTRRFFGSSTRSLSSSRDEPWHNTHSATSSKSTARRLQQLVTDAGSSQPITVPDGPVGLTYCADNRLTNGPHPYPSACDRFVLCSSNLTYAFSCAACVEPSGSGVGSGGAGGALLGQRNELLLCLGQASLSYNPTLRLCDWPVNVPDCLPPLPTATSAPTPDVTAASGPEADGAANGGGGAAGDGAAGGEDFRTSNGPAPVPAPSDSSSPSDSLPSLDELVEQFPLDFRTSLPYKPIPGYGGEWPDWDPNDIFGQDDDKDGDKDGGKRPGGGKGPDGGDGDGDGDGGGASGSKGDVCSSYAGFITAADPSPVFGVPACGPGATSCRAEGLGGKGPTEAGAPNTLYGECEDGPYNSSTRLGASDAYVGGVGLSAFVPGQPLQSGRLAFASAVVSCGGGILPGSRTLLDFYYTADISAANPNRRWTRIGTVPCSPGVYVDPTTGLATIDSPAFFLPSPPPVLAAATGAADGVYGTVAVRVQLRDPSGGLPPTLLAPPCSYGLYGSNDRDDIIVQVCPRPKLEDILGGMGPGGTDRGAQQSGPGAAGGDGSGDSGSGSGNDSGTGNGDNGNGNGFINVARMSALQLLETFSAVVPR